MYSPDSLSILPQIKAEEELQELVFPMKTEELQRFQESVKKRNVQAYKWVMKEVTSIDCTYS